MRRAEDRKSECSVNGHHGYIVVVKEFGEPAEAPLPVDVAGPIEAAYAKIAVREAVDCPPEVEDHIVRQISGDRIGIGYPEVEQVRVEDVLVPQLMAEIIAVGGGTKTLFPG